MYPYLGLCVCVCETVSPYRLWCWLTDIISVSFDLSSGSKGEGHLPLSAQSFRQGQKPPWRYSMHRPLAPQSNQSGLLTVMSVCVGWRPRLSVPLPCDVLVCLALRTNFLLSNLFVGEILYLSRRLFACFSSGPSTLHTLLQIVLFVHVSVLCLITTVCCEWSDDSCFPSVVWFGTSFSYIAY